MSCGRRLRLSTVPPLPSAAQGVGEFEFPGSATFSWLPFSFEGVFCRQTLYAVITTQGRGGDIFLTTGRHSGKFRGHTLPPINLHLSKED